MWSATFCSRSQRVLHCSLTLARRTTPSERKSPRRSRTSEPSCRAQMRKRFCSALGCNTILNVEVFRDEQSLVRVWPRDFFKETIRCVRNRSASTKFWGDTLTDTEPEQPRETPSAGGPQSLQGGMAYKTEFLMRCSTSSSLSAVPRALRSRDLVVHG